MQRVLRHLRCILQSELKSELKHCVLEDFELYNAMGSLPSGKPSDLCGHTFVCTYSISEILCDFYEVVQLSGRVERNFSVHVELSGRFLQFLSSSSRGHSILAVLAAIRTELTV